jgi:N-acetyl-gamma-glutamyl-phosphate reductase
MSETKKIRVILVGGSGYAGFEAVRWLLRHPSAELVGVYGPETELGALEEFYPLLSKQCTMRQEVFAPDKLPQLQADLAMLCVPHKVAMSYVPALREAGLRVIDWSADYRIQDADLYEKWYCPHTDSERLPEAVYGLPEYFSEQIQGAGLVANPGCYPTSATLPLAPILQAGLIEPDGIIVNAGSGVSGAGRSPSPKCHYPERNENFEAYAVGTHRHMPEIEQNLRNITGKPANVLFVPHLIPMDRGILSTIYARPARDVSAQELTDVLQSAYADAPFVRVRGTDLLPATKHVAYTNFCDVAARVAQGWVILFGALDNLIKGASGQAIQNMNLMFGLPEATGLV